MSSNFPNNNIPNKVKVNRGFLRMAMFLSDGNVPQVKRLITQSSLGLTDDPTIPKAYAKRYKKYTWDQLWTKDEEEWLISFNKKFENDTRE